MSRRPQPTVAELDPEGRVPARIFVLAVGFVSIAISTGLSLTPSAKEQLSYPGIGWVGVCVIAASYGYFFLAANPFGAALTRMNFQIFLGGIGLASILNSISQFGSDTLIRDDWGAVCLGLALILAAPYRASREILWFTAQAVSVTFLLAVVQNMTSTTTAVLGILALVAVAPVVAIGLGAAAYSRSLVASLRESRTAAVESRAQSGERLRKKLGETDALGELGALRSAVVPYLRRLAETGEVRPGDPLLAEQLASGLRRAIVERLSAGSLADVVTDYDDKDRIANALNTRHRTALRAVVSAAVLEGPLEGSSLVFRRQANLGRGLLTLPSTEAHRARLAPFLRALRVVFDEVQVSSVDGAVIVAFCFDPDPDPPAVSW